MTTGYAAASANAILNSQWRQVAFTAPAGVFIKMHLGDPGAAGTANAAATTTRASATFSAASGGAIALSNSPAITSTATETWSHFSLWDASTAGTFLGSAALTTAKSVVSGDVGTFTSLGISLSPIAA